MNQTTGNLSDATFLITGASRGLGLALAAAAGAAGARVVLTARGEARLQQAVADLRRRGCDAHAIAADVADLADAQRVAAEAAALAGPVDVLVHNASTLGATPLPLLLDADPDDVARTFATNVLGPFALSRAIVGSMLVRGGGTVVHVSSDAAVEAYPGWGAYGAAKAALDHLSRIWAAELEGSPVRVFAVDPGEMDTAMHAAALPEADRATLADPRQVAARILALIADPQAVPHGARVRAGAQEVAS